LRGGVSSPPAEDYPKGEVAFHKCKISGIRKTTSSPFGATPPQEGNFYLWNNFVIIKIKKTLTPA
jgi:hypothetical protein